MAKGERARPERTNEERERARVERERRRAERAGLAAPDGSPSLESDPDVAPEPVVPPEPEAEPTPEAIAPPERAEPPELVPEPTIAPAFLEAEAGHAPIDPPERMEPPAVEIEVEPGPEPVVPETEPAQPAPVEPVESEPVEAVEPAPPEPEPLAAEPEAVAETPDVEPVAEPIPTEPEREPVAEPAPAEPVHEGEPLAENPGQHPDEHLPADEAAGYPIPGLPEGPEPPAREPLPEPPPRLRAAEPTPMRRAFRRDRAAAGGAGGAALASDGRSAGGGRHRSRWIAVIALLLIGIVVAVLVYSLGRSSGNTTAKAPPVVKVLIPEGKTRLQIAQIASAAGLKGSYRRAARSSPLLNPTSYGAPHGTSTLEGFLFPATYDMKKGAPSSRLVEEQLTAFQENFTAEYAKRARDLGLTPYELLTVASMIEREAQLPSDRAKIAAVIYNRLKAGIPLGIDATIYYAVENGHDIPTYTKELTTSQLETDSAYNTRLRKGLPPTPISNPGVASIQAAAHPAHASYLYYVAGADGCGEQKFATTEEKFNEDVAAYEAAKHANGGHPPACKH